MELLDLKDYLEDAVLRAGQRKIGVQKLAHGTATDDWVVCKVSGAETVDLHLEIHREFDNKWLVVQVTGHYNPNGPIRAIDCCYEWLKTLCLTLKVGKEIVLGGPTPAVQQRFVCLSADHNDEIAAGYKVSFGNFGDGFYMRSSPAKGMPFRHEDRHYTNGRAIVGGRYATPIVPEKHTWIVAQHPSEETFFVSGEFNWPKRGQQSYTELKLLTDLATGAKPVFGKEAGAQIICMDRKGETRIEYLGSDNVNVIASYGSITSYVEANSGPGQKYYGLVSISPLYHLLSVGF